MEDDQQERDVDDQVGGADGKEVSQQAVMKTTVIENLIKANMTPNDKDAILKAESLKGLAQFLVAVCSNPQHEQEFAAICQQPNGLLPILGTAAGVTHYASVSGMGSVVMIVSQVGRALNTMRKYRRLNFPSEMAANCSTEASTRECDLLISAHRKLDEQHLAATGEIVFRNESSAAPIDFSSAIELRMTMFCHLVSLLPHLLFAKVKAVFKPECSTADNVNLATPVISETIEDIFRALEQIFKLCYSK